MSSLRCFAKIPGIPDSVPMKVEENGWPTFPGRSGANAGRRAAGDGRRRARLPRQLRRDRLPLVQPARRRHLVATGRSSTSGCSTAHTARSPPSRPTASSWPRCTATSVPPTTCRAALRLALRLRSRKARGPSRPSCRRGRVRAIVEGRDLRLVRRVRFLVGGRRLRRIRRAPAADQPGVIRREVPRPTATACGPDCGSGRPAGATGQDHSRCR